MVQLKKWSPMPCNKTGFAFESVGETVKCDHSNEIYWVLLSSGAIYYDLQTSSNAWVLNVVEDR